MTPFEYITSELHPDLCTSTALLYDDMDSQSGRSLPIIYEPFDPSRKAHWQDRGALFDFLLTTCGEGKRLLDFGPGDGWPSLIVAPFAAEVVGVDGSARRVSVCRENAHRMGIANATFVHVPPGMKLPFEDGSFDGILAASSVEQTPDPHATLAELFRVLKHGGRLRIRYEALGRYRGGHEEDAWLLPLDAGRCRLILYDRHVREERVSQVGLTFALPAATLCQALDVPDRHALRFQDITVAHLEQLRPALREARLCQTVHPSGRTYNRFLREVGFQVVSPTHDGSHAAGELFDALPPVSRPRDLAGVDATLRPIVEIITRLPAPVEGDPMMTAIKD